MKVVLDASLIIAASVAKERHHQAALTWLNDSINEGNEHVLVSHTIAELYAGLTKHIAPRYARPIIEDQINLAAEIVELQTIDYTQAVQEVTASGLTSGIIYDAVIAQAARRIQADFIASLNRKHFERVWPPAQLIVPS